jgi:putative tricarboxylic transport membrane protein
MTTQGTDRLAGSILLVFAGLWCWGVVAMIPDIGAAPVGPRGFPLGLGLLLAALSALLVISSFIGPRSQPVEKPSAQAGQFWDELWAVSSTLAILVGYGVLMYATGFIIATVITVVASLVLVLGKRSWRLVGGLSLGTAFGGYIVFNKILGVYLPHGRWLDFWF